MKLNFKKVVLIALLCWAGVKLYNRYQAENTIDWTSIPNRTSVEVNQEELMEFLPVWSDYVRQDVGGKHMENDLSPQTEKWLLRRKWRPERFFYVEQRLRVILKTLEHYQNNQRLIIGLEQQLAALRAQQQQTGQYDPQIASLGSSLENMIREQQARLNVEQITLQEMNLVGPLQSVVRDALEQQPLSENR